MLREITAIPIPDPGIVSTSRDILSIRLKNQERDPIINFEMLAKYLDDTSFMLKFDAYMEMYYLIQEMGMTDVIYKQFVEFVAAKQGAIQFYFRHNMLICAARRWAQTLYEYQNVFPRVLTKKNIDLLLAKHKVGTVGILTSVPVEPEVLWDKPPQHPSDNEIHYVISNSTPTVEAITLAMTHKCNVVLILSRAGIWEVRSRHQTTNPTPIIEAIREQLRILQSARTPPIGGDDPRIEFCAQLNRMFRDFEFSIRYTEMPEVNYFFMA
jgi:hypothetical protein